jgi:predicted dithiol-disulfide oxidoreductase (DUF899 family)
MTGQQAAPRVVDRAQWRTERVQLLELEKSLTRARDVLNRMRRELPAVRVAQPYEFTGPGGTSTLLDLFEGRRQLIVQHVMFGPGWRQACAGCAFQADSLGHLAHLHARDTTFAAVSRAPYPELAAFRKRMGWEFPWYSSAGSTFNYDFGVSLDERVAPIDWNYRSARELRRAGLGAIADAEELPGVSVFLRAGPPGEEHVLHTYSTYARGVEPLLGTYALLDLTPLGRGEGWDGMPSIGAGRGWIRLHDEYATADGISCEHTFDGQGLEH